MDLKTNGFKIDCIDFIRVNVTQNFFFDKRKHKKSARNMERKSSKDNIKYRERERERERGGGGGTEIGA